LLKFNKWTYSNIKNYIELLEINFGFNLGLSLCVSCDFFGIQQVESQIIVLLSNSISGFCSLQQQLNKFPIN
jgi:hypothetical protein